MTIKPWKRLSENLKLRRNLQSTLLPIAEYASLASPNAWELIKDFKDRISNRRKEETRYRRNLMEAQGIKTKTGLLQKIKELQEEEKRLWSECRPDLYA